MSEKKKFLVTGHPKCGTGYFAFLLNRYGFDVPHERKMGKDGVCSWMSVDEKGPYPFPNPPTVDYEFENLIYVLRNPLDAIQTIANVEARHMESKRFREKVLNYSLEDGFRGACDSYMGWFGKAAVEFHRTRAPVLKVIPVEHANELVAELLGVDPLPLENLPPSNFNTRSHTYEKVPKKEVFRALDEFQQDCVRRVIEEWYPDELVFI